MLAKNIVFITLFLMSHMLGSQNNQFTLEEAIEYGLKKNRELKELNLNIADAEKQVLEYWAIGLPKVSGSMQLQHFVEIPQSLLPTAVLPPGAAPPGQDFVAVQFGTKNVVNGTIDASALIFDGSFLVGLKAQRMYKELRQKELNAGITDMKYNITKAYLNVLVAEKSKSILNNNLEILERNLSDAKKTFEQGFIEQLDVDRIQLSKNQLETELTAIEGNLSIAQNLLKFQMGYPMEDSIAVNETLEDIVGVEMEQKSVLNEKINFNSRPEYQVANQGLALSNVNIQQLRAGYLPSLTGFASFSRQLNRQDLFDNNELGWLPSSLVGLNLSVDIFDGLDRHAKIQRAKITKEQTINQLNTLEASIRMEVQNAKAQHQIALERKMQAEDNLALAERIYNTTKIKFREGVGTSTERAVAEGDFYQAQSQYVNALYDLLNAYTDLQKALGKI